MSAIGVLREGPLHAAIKAELAREGDRLEVSIGRHVIDVVRADGELVEVQTGGFSPLGPKLDTLLDAHPMRIVHPVAAERRIVRVDEHGQVLSARVSPRRDTVLQIFDRLVSFPALVDHPNLTLEVLLTREDHIRGAAPVRVRRRTRDPGERRLVAILDRVEIRSASDLLSLAAPLPAGESFTTRELGRARGCTLLLAQRIVFCLRTLELLEAAGRRGSAPLYRLVSLPTSGTSAPVGGTLEPPPS